MAEAGTENGGGTSSQELLGEVQRAATDQHATPNPADWKSSIPQDLRQEKMWETFKGPDDVFKSYANLFKAQGSMARIPDEKTPPEKAKEFWSKVGLPESADKYDLKRPEKLPEGLTYFDDLEKGFAQHMHKANAPKQFVQAALDYWNNEVAPKMIEPAASHEDVTAKLKDAWGKDYEINMSGAERFIRAYVDAETASAFDSLPMEKQIAINTLFARIGSKLGEDNSISLMKDGKNVTTDTQSSLRARQVEILNDPRYVSGIKQIRQPFIDEMTQISRKLSELMG